MVERNTVNQNGVFEWIVDPTDGVTHRRFIPNGTINGMIESFNSFMNIEKNKLLYC